MNEVPEFKPFNKIPRLSRDVVITEKIDGTNASIYINDDTFLVGSRNRWITPEDDNYGFARWAHINKDELVKLGNGHHFGEWWGNGIQRNYSQPDKKFTLFNTNRWTNAVDLPSCCSVVPILYTGAFEDYLVMLGVKQVMKELKEKGSVIAPGFMKPEGIVIYHKASNTLFKKTLDNDEAPKGKNNE